MSHWLRSGLSMPKASRSSSHKQQRQLSRSVVRGKGDIPRVNNIVDSDAETHRNPHTSYSASHSSLHANAENETRPFAQIYRTITVLGQGAFGKVLKCVRLSDKQIVAVKQVDIRKSQAGRNGDQERRSRAINAVMDEIALLQHIRCQSDDTCAMVRVNRAFYYGDYEQFNIEMEYVQGGDGRALRSAIQDGEFGDERAGVSALTKMAANVIYMLNEVHRQCILHLDVKPENLLWDANANRLLLSDFGVSCFAQDCFGNDNGTTVYQDPLARTQKYTTVFSDVYSLAITFFELVSGQSYIDEETYDEDMSMNDIYQHNMDHYIRPKLALFVPRSAERVLLEFIIQGAVPNDISARPSLSTVVYALRFNDPRQMKHLASEEYAVIDGLCNNSNN